MRKGPHPAWFFLLILPFGASFGFVSVALNYLAVNRAHVPVDAFAQVTAAAFFVHGIKFLWAPVVDQTLSKRTWYGIALGLTILGTLASSVMPLGVETLEALKWVVVASQLGLTLMGMACENFLADLPEEEKGRASGWYQAGNFVGLGLGGDLALELSSKLPQQWMVGAVMGLLMLPSALALRAIREPPHQPTGLTKALRELGHNLESVLYRELTWHRRPVREANPARLAVELAALGAAGWALRAYLPGQRWLLVLWALLVVRWGLSLFYRWDYALNLLGLTGLLICLSPVGAGAVSNLWASVAGDWGASEVMVARVTGSVGGVVGGVGAMLGGYLADRLNRRLAYALAGFATALSGVAMALAPRTDWAYAGFSLLYTLFNGVAFAAFSAFVLETIGKGSAATKYNIFASLANVAIGYMTTIDSQAYKAGGGSRMLYTDAACTGLGIIGLLVLVAVVRKLAPPAEAAPQAAPAPGAT